MTARHARPLVAYLCTALAAALLLVQGGVGVPRDVPGVSGVIGGVGTLHLGEEVLVMPLHGRDEVAAVGRVVPQRVAEERSVLRAAAPAASAAPRRVAPAAAAAPVRPRDTSAAQSGVRPQAGSQGHAAKPAPTAGAKPRVDKPGRGRVLAKGHTRGSTGNGRVMAKGHTRGSTGFTGSARSTVGGSPRAARASQAGQRAKGHGRPSGKPTRR